MNSLSTDNKFLSIFILHIDSRFGAWDGLHQSIYQDDIVSRPYTTVVVQKFAFKSLASVATALQTTPSLSILKHQCISHQICTDVENGYILIDYHVEISNTLMKLVVLVPPPL